MDVARPRQLIEVPEVRVEARAEAAQIRRAEKMRIPGRLLARRAAQRMSRVRAPDPGLATSVVLEYSWRPGPLRIEPSVQIRSPQVIGDRPRERPERVRTGATS